MPRESKASKQARALEVCERMGNYYPAEECFLHHQSPFQLVCAVALSAQTTDVAVNKVTPELFGRWPDPASMAEASVAEVASVIHTLGFYKSKATRLVAAAQMLMSDWGGEVPQTMAELVKLPGVGRKTANIVLNVAFGKVEGIAVDTHVHRISKRLGFTTKKEPLDAEQDLLKIIPRELWKPVNHQWVRFGREFCDARRPRCEACFLADICPYFQKQLGSSARSGK